VATPFAHTLGIHGEISVLFIEKYLTSNWN